MATPSQFFDELSGQPQALRRLADHYASPAGRARLAQCSTSVPALLVGMGASHHAGLLAAHALRQRGQAVAALEAAEVLYEPTGVLAQARDLVYVSQSGASGEVQPLLDRLPAGARVIALTNDDRSLLAQRAHMRLPLLAGPEETVATKTMTNSVALLWLLVQQWTEGLEDTDFGVLHALADDLQHTLDQAPALSDQWLAELGQARAYVTIGVGLQAITARHTAMILMEWLKVPALSASLGAFRHGPIEIAQPGLGFVLFAAPGPAYASTCRLASELTDYGASVLLVEQGRARRAAEPAALALPLPSVLSAILDSLPLQIFAESLARNRGPKPGFRHIAKVVTIH